MELIIPDYARKLIFNNECLIIKPINFSFEEAVEVSKALGASPPHYDKSGFNHLCINNPYYYINFCEGLSSALTYNTPDISLRDMYKRIEW